jgi:hypothetical protein
MNTRIAGLALAGICLLSMNLLAADIMPVDAKTPLFRIFAAGPGKAADTQHINFDNKRPLLVIRGVSDVRLDRERKGVLITLTREDARKFAQLTREYKQGMLLLEGEGRLLEALQISSPIENGVIEFKYPDDAEVATYVRKRFRLAEFKQR